MQNYLYIILPVSLAGQEANIQLILPRYLTEAFDEALHRDPHQQKHFCALVDGNKTQLSLLKKYARQHNINLTIVLDIIHVIEYLWKTAFAFYGDTSQQAEAWGL